MEELEVAINKAGDFIKINCIRVACIEKALSLIGMECHITGSRSEGVHVGESDTDILCIGIDIEAITKHTPGATHSLEVLLETESNKPGYGKLRVQQCNLEKDIHIMTYMQKPLKFLCNKIGNSYYLSNKKSIDATSIFAYHILPWSGGRLASVEINGPAKHVSVEMGKEQADIDILYAIPCRQITQEISKWRTRPRTLPRSDLVEEISLLPIFMVPVGHRLSSPKTQDFQWKFSFNLHERTLMRNLSGPQLICCNILKVLKYQLKENKSLYSGVAEDSMLKSYYFKTCFLWTLERIPEANWTTDNIIPNTILSLEYFIKCLQDKFCPHYFIPDNNLFEGKHVHMADTSQFQHFLVSLCDKDHPLWKVLVTKVIQMLNGMYMKKQAIIDAVSTCRNLLILSVKTEDVEKAIDELQNQNTVIESLPATEYDSDFKETMMKSLQHHIEILNGYQGNIAIDTQTDNLDFCTVKLKAATIHYKMGHLDNALKVTKMVIERNATNIMYFTGFTHVKDPTFNAKENCKKNWKTLMMDNIYYDLLFIPAEKKLCLPAIQLLLCEGRGVVMNPLVYAYYLQFCIMKENGSKVKEVKDLLYHLQSLVNLKEKAGFIFTDWEIVSFCFLQLGSFQESYQNLKIAISKRDSGNAHFWQLALLVHACLTHSHTMTPIDGSGKEAF